MRACVAFGPLTAGAKTAVEQLVSDVAGPNDTVNSSCYMPEYV